MRRRHRHARRPSRRPSSSARPRPLDRVAHRRARCPRRRSSRRRCRPAARRRRRRARRATRRAARRSTSSRSGSWPQIASSSSAASSTVVANGPIWSSDDANAIEPVARHARRTSASRRPRRTAPRAGGSSRRCRSRAPSGANPAATAAAEPPLEPPGTRVEVVRVAGRAERRVLGRRTHRELVEVRLADDRPRPRRAARSTTVASYGGRQPSRIRDEHVVGIPRVHRLSLSAIGTPASGPGSSPRATAASTASAAARASSASTRLNAWISASRASIAREVLLEHVARRAAPPARTSAGDRRARGHGASPRMRGTRKRPSSAAGARASTSSRSSAGPHLVGAAARSRAAAGARSAARPSVSSADTCAAWSRIAPSSLGERVDLVVGEREARRGCATCSTSARVMRGFGHRRRQTLLVRVELAERERPPLVRAPGPSPGSG